MNEFLSLLEMIKERERKLGVRRETGNLELPKEVHHLRMNGAPTFALIGSFNEVGGIRTWIESLDRSVDPDVARLIGVGFPNGDRHPNIGKPMISAPVLSGLEACRMLADIADVVVLWGTANSYRIAPRKKCRAAVLRCSHSSGDFPWEKRLFMNPAGIDLHAAVSDAARSIYPVRLRDQVEIIPNGLDPRRVEARVSREQIRNKWGFSEKEKVIIYVGRTYHTKRPLAVAQAVAALHWAGETQWRGVIVGAYDADDLEKAASKIAGKYVRCLGPTDDIGSQLAAADCGLFASTVETFGFTLVEYWMAGLPVVSVPVGIALEFPQFVRGVEMNYDANDLAESILADSGDPVATLERASKAKEYAIKEFGLREFGQRWGNAILRLAKDRSNRLAQIQA